MPVDYQAVADDFDIRTGAEYEYSENLEGKFSFAGKDFTFPVQIKHSANGIGITFEIHSYVTSTATAEQIWGWLKQTKLPDTKTSQWPAEGDVATYTRGQVSSAYYMDEIKRFDLRP